MSTRTNKKRSDVARQQSALKRGMQSHTNYFACNLWRQTRIYPNCKGESYTQAFFRLWSTRKNERKRRKNKSRKEAAKIKGYSCSLVVTVVCRTTRPKTGKKKEERMCNAMQRDITYDAGKRPKSRSKRLKKGETKKNKKK
ncbi:hypothetical protein EJ02DRAFT_172712 [Clathrospora elynae]|uniref:Uncharacterized protein n=1 Tax=Clathrospora elynae TaxID=706981 RepID=A0A6A5T388_9PLEO|nr:hypothetical protein EJ02DRAFT_172712 [Clathrospora elynae]